MSNRLFVGNLSYGVTETDLQDAFGAYGEVSEVKVVTDRETGRSRGFAFVTMNDEDAARKAMDAMNGSVLDGRPLRVDQAQERKDRSNGGGGGYGGRSRGGFDGGRGGRSSGRRDDW